ncbi:FkbM family methyltransferase [Synechocystis sp. FACHB-383]|uniref:FkbM family methyltransferase n=1 Tax=Synechocystis sp. FACHB-383 TaxID=2692864 RepID=UPI0016820E55|nr:FkbM family methyltransferase [Synechocystis sp. FACHB-383]MBD2654400.1 FkbM family methyltransferase [Synechocystis sp. FACHB-383]
MNDASNAVKVYSNYLSNICPDINPGIVSGVVACLENTQWENPQSVDDFNQIAVIALIEAEYCDDLTVRQLYVEMALEALNNSLSIEKSCIALAHLSFLMSMIGDRSQAVNLAWDGWLTLTTQNLEVNHKGALVYLPVVKSGLERYRARVLIYILSKASLKQRLLLLLSEALCFSSLVFYNQTGLRWLQLARGVNPNSSGLNLKLGAAMCTAKQWEGIYYLCHVHDVAPDDHQLMQALYLACRDVGKVAEAQRWLALAYESKSVPGDQSKKWTDLAVDSPFTYVVFDDDIVLAVEASFKSLVTSVLIAEGDWFEDEMEFWRDWIKPGMTVIDVGANVGVYTFSSAKQVGETGRVLAVEPFLGCVRCLQETCQINGFDWVTVCPGAASNRQCTARLSLNSASELNELIMDDREGGVVEVVECFTLDYLFEQDGLERVDIIKIDAEGHELAVLAGSERVLSKFSPVILYENIAGSHGSNQAVAEYLVSIGYQLLRYQPYVRQLIPIESVAQVGGSLNIIAIRNH